MFLLLSAYPFENFSLEGKWQDTLFKKCIANTFLQQIISFFYSHLNQHFQFILDFVSLKPTPHPEGSNNSRMSSRRSSSEERDALNDSYLSDSFSMLSVSTSNIPNHFTNRMSQYSPR